MLNRFDVEKKFFKLLENGDETAIARAIGHSVGYVQQLYSPDNDRESTLFRAIKELRAWRDSSPERGERALQTFVDLVEFDSPDIVADLELERRRLVEEIAEWELAEMETGKTAQQKFDELEDVVIRAERLLIAKRSEMNPVREKMAAAVESKRRNGHK